MHKHCKHIKDDLSSQNEARRYVLEHELSRPKTTKITPITIGITILVLPALVGLVLIFMPWNVASFAWYKVLSFVVPYLVITLIGLRPLLISIVKCYQHYCRDDIRRMCLCKPTCSEYALAVLHKYPIVIAIYKIIYRLTVTCTGSKYKIDEP